MDTGLTHAERAREVLERAVSLAGHVADLLGDRGELDFAAAGARPAVLRKP